MEQIAQLQKTVSDAIEREAGKLVQTAPENLYIPIKYTLDNGGKRLRPVMLLLACELFSGKTEDAIPAAIGIEVFHNFTLLHDDIMDQAEMRRNRPCVHVKFDPNAAILSGDAMSILAYQYLLKTKSAQIFEILQLFSQTAIEVCEGQQYDMDFENRANVGINEYLEMIRLKTAVLIAASFSIGAKIAGASTEDSQNLYDFGLNLGLAFQLQDDLLDVYADQEKFGKKIGGDIVSNKKTYLLLKALEEASPNQKLILNGWIGKNEFDPHEKIAAITAVFNDLKIETATREKTEQFYRQAIASLESLTLPAPKKQVLKKLADSLMVREH